MLCDLVVTGKRILGRQPGQGLPPQDAALELFLYVIASSFPFPEFLASLTVHTFRVGTACNLEKTGVPFATVVAGLPCERWSRT